MTAYNIIRQGLSLVYETPVTDADARRFSVPILRLLIADCFEAENNSRDDDNQLTEIPKVIEGGSGDVNGDGELGADDASLILRYTQGLNPLTELQKEEADVNADGKVDATDAQIILENLVGFVQTINIGEITIPYNDYLTNVCLPYGIAWKWCEANGRGDDALMYRQLYEEAKHIGGSGKWNLT